MNLDSSGFTSAIWIQLWQVTLLVVAVGIVVRVGCRHRPHLAYLLWILVAVKCLTPPVWSSPTGIFSWAQLQMVEQQPAGLAETTGELPLVSEIPVPQKSLEPGMLSGVPFEAAEETLAPAQSSISFTTILAVLWTLGVVLLGSVVLLRWFRCYRLLNRTTVACKQTLEAQVIDIARRLGVRRRVRVIVTSSPLGPAVFGLFRPVILLPEAILEGKSAEEIEPILAHEIIHIRRGDPIVGSVQLLAQLVWWFHPLIWWANRQAYRAGERCCDEEVVTGLGCKPSRYARCLLDVIERKQSLQPVVGLPGVRPADVTSARLENIVKYSERFHRRTPRWYWVIVMLTAVVVIPGADLVLPANDSAGIQKLEDQPLTLNWNVDLYDVNLDDPQQVVDRIGAESVEFLPNGRTVVTAGFFYDGKRKRSFGQIWLWDVATGEQKVKLRGKADTMYARRAGSLAVSPDGNTIAVAGSVRKGKVFAQLVELWDVKTGTLRASVSRSLDYTVSCVVFSPDGKQLAIAQGNGDVRLWEGERADIIHLKTHADGIWPITYSPDGRMLVTGNGDDSITFWNPLNGAKIAHIPAEKDIKGIFCLAFSPNGKLLAAGGNPRTEGRCPIRIWDVEAVTSRIPNSDKVTRPRAKLDGHASHIYSLAFSPDGKMLASASQDTTIKLWDVENAKEVAAITDHKDFVYDVAFSPDGKKLASVGRDALKMWTIDEALRD